MAASSGAPSNLLVTLTSPRSPAAEAYRTLRTNLQFSSLDRSVRLVLVTSAGPGEGKSTTLANLAVASAEAGLRVIAADTDLRRPRLHELFGLPQAPGFSNTVLQDPAAPLPLQDSVVPGLRVLTSGSLPPNPSELLSSQRGARVIAALAEQADLVLLDSPPVGPVADAAVLATRCDGVLLVLSAGKTSRDAAKRARAQLDRVGARILGVVLNNVRLDPSLARYYGTR